uniref:GumC family protein n=1 Tax=Desertifilum tharense IPPAS B-1220 TaxID=1781255 RepID=A0ACD5GQY9_9CYAN
MPTGKFSQGTPRNGQQPIPLNYYASSLQEKDEFDPKQLFNIIKRRIWVLVGVTAAFTGAIWVWTGTRDLVYLSEFRMLVEPVSEPSSSRELVTSRQPDSGFDYATQIEVLRSPKLLEPIIESLKSAYPTISYGEVISKLTITQVQDNQARPTKILTISYRDSDPQKIRTVLDTLVEGYSLYGIELRQQSLQRGVQFVEEQLPLLRDRVDSLQVELESFRRRYSLIDPESRGTEISSLMNLVNQQQKESQTELAQKQSLYVVLQRQLGVNPREAFTASALSESPRYQELLNQLLQVESEIAQESVRFLPDSPNMQVLLEKRENLLPLLNRESQRVLGTQSTLTVSGDLAPISVDLSKELVRTTNEIQVVQVRLAALEQVEAQLRQEFALIPALARQYTDLQRELQVANNSLNRFLATRETLQIEAAQKAVSWQVVSDPYTPFSPISPNLPRNLALGTVAGMLLGIAAALLAEQLDNAFHSPNEIKELTGLPLLGLIPFKRGLQRQDESREVSVAGRNWSSLGNWNARVSTNGSSSNGKGSDGENGHLLSNSAQGMDYNSSPFLEAFRSLYTNIRFLSSDTPIRSLVISSCLPAEGKSTVALYLARAAAAMSQRVLLVDADLRRPQIHARLGLPNMRGLSNAITTDIDPNEVILRSPFDDHLFVLTAGQIPPDPIKLLSSRKMQNLIEQFQTAFDLTIYDTPPTLGLADGSILGVRADGVLLVVGMGKTGRSELNQTLDNLKLSYVPVLGLIANGVKGLSTGADYYYRYYTPETRSRDAANPLPEVNHDGISRE